MLAALTVALCLSAAPLNAARAWNPGYGYSPVYPYAPGYWQGYPGYWLQTPGNGWHGYTEPRWYMRGRMNRYGDYRIDIKLRDISMYDMYMMWLLYNGY